VNDRKRYAIVGTGIRSQMFSKALLGDFKDHGRLVAYCDINQVRMDLYNRWYAKELKAAPIATYKPERFDDMIREQKVDCAIVTSIDRTHHRYICRAMELGCDVITEKPMTIDAEKCQQILDTQKRTGKRLTVAFNYRYSPRNAKVKELLMGGTIGEVISVHFEWLLDTQHGADYFRRWHRDKRNSGGLLVHKATHHFDLVNWWLASRPKTVFAMGDLRFYGRENAEERGVTRFYDRAFGRKNSEGDPFAIHMDEPSNGIGSHEMYLQAEQEDGYVRDQSVFGDGISIEDDIAVMVRYASRATMSYHLTASSPWEGYRVAFNGTKGRLELDVVERPYVGGAEPDHNLAHNVGGSSEERVNEPVTLLLRPHWGVPIRIDLPQTTEGGHGGGDRRLLKDIFIGAGDDPLGRAASHVDGAISILTGIAANRSLACGLPVDVESLIRFGKADQVNQ
jgi:predicted dehydrogenase